MSSHEENLAYAAQMERELADLLKELAGPDPYVAFDEPSADMSRAAPTQPDLIADPVNDYAVGDARVRDALVTPRAPVRTARRTIDPENVINVPIAEAVPAEPVTANVPVVASKSNADAQFAQFIQLSRAANSQARSSGNYIATVVTALGEDGSSSTEAGVVAWLARICQAYIAAEQGATAAAMPVTEPLVVVQTTLADYGRAAEAHPDLLPVYLPRGLDPAARAAALSLMVYGGAGDYTWRYRGPENQAVMPSVVRKGMPGGFNRLLAVMPDDVILPPIGGHSLTRAALGSLERFYRTSFGNDLMDTAMKTCWALAGVYVAPRAADVNGYHPGRNFRTVRTTQVTEGGVDLGALPDTVNPEPPPGEPIEAFVWQGPRDDRQFNRLGGGAWAIIQQRIAEGDYDNEAFAAAGVQRGDYDHLELMHAAFRFRWHQMEDADDGQGGQIRRRQAYEFDFPRDDLHDNIGDLPPDRRREFRALEALYFNLTQEDLFDPPADDVPPQRFWRDDILNCYGAYDTQGVYLPSLDVPTVVGVVSNYYRPARIVATRSHLTPAIMFQRMQSYIAHLHLANFHAFVDSDMFPADLSAAPRTHARAFIKVPPALRSYFFMTTLDPRAYPGQNWRVLEDALFVRHATNETPYAGFAVPGTWETDQSSRVHVGRKSTNYAALESAVRADVEDGSRIDALADFAGTQFDIVVGTNGAMRPLAFSPRIAAGRLYDPVVLVAPMGRSSLPAGRAVPAHFIVAK